MRIKDVFVVSDWLQISFHSFLQVFGFVSDAVSLFSVPSTAVTLFFL